MAELERREVETEKSEEASLAELGRRLSEQTTRLVQQEVELAKLELSEKGKRIGAGAGAFGGAGVVALYGLGAVIAAAILVLATAVAPWLAALIVAVVLFAIAGVMALVGKRKVASATPPLPEQAIASSKQDVEEVKARAKEGRA
jgi:membrane protein